MLILNYYSFCLGNKLAIKRHGGLESPSTCSSSHYVEVEWMIAARGPQ
jgi:hypothetical protein